MTEFFTAQTEQKKRVCRIFPAYPLLFIET
jgi:hypothetical protein